MPFGLVFNNKIDPSVLNSLTLKRLVKITTQSIWCDHEEDLKPFTVSLIYSPVSYLYVWLLKF